MLRLAVAFTMITTPAFALSCKAPNFGEAFNRVAAAEEVYNLGYGQLRDAGPIQEYVEGQPREVVVAFVGKLLGGNGFGETQSLPVTLKTECAASWCGPIPAFGEQMLVFLEQGEGELILTSSACPGDYHLNPSLGQVSAVRSCMSTLECGPDEIEAFDLN